MAEAHKDFRTLFCEQFDCTQTEYEERAFRACLYRRARPVARLARSLRKSCFGLDFTLLRYLGDTRSLEEVRVELAAFKDANNARPHFFRNALRIRISGRRVARLARRVFSRPMGHAKAQQ